MLKPARAFTAEHGSTFWLWLLTAAPFVPGALEFLRRGIPDRLLAGDAAALELGTWHAARGQQLLGPYSRFGWNHPGPAFFYLAAPLYELFGERGPALSLFAFGCDFLSAAAIVFTAFRLRGRDFAVIVAALLAVLELVALPFLLANEWNPVFPILPFVWCCFLATCIATGGAASLPILAAVGSIVIQTHVGYAPEVIGLSVYAMARRPLRGAADRLSSGWIAPVTIAIVAVFWALPVLETLTTRPGNLQRIVWFFWPFGSQIPAQSWPTAVGTIVRQMAAVPWAIAGTVMQRSLPEPGFVSVSLIAAAELGGLAASWRQARRQRDPVPRALAEIAVLTASIAVVSVRAIRGDVLMYLVSWSSVVGLLSLAVIAASAVSRIQPRLGPARTHSGVMAVASVCVGLALTAPITRPSVIHGSIVEVDQIAPLVNDFLRARGGDAPTVVIHSRETWPVALGVILYLRKHATPVAVEGEWIGVAGRRLAQTPGPHPGLFFVNDRFAPPLRPEDDAVEIASARGVHVFFEPLRK